MVIRLFGIINNSDMVVVNLNKVYICIDLKSFYASVECKERGLDPMTTNLVVADESRTNKTVCLAITPSLKSYELGGRARLYEVIRKVRDINNERRKKIPNHRFVGKSYNDTELKNNPRLELDFIVAPPRMSYYMEYSTQIYNVYLKYLAPEDIYVYSIDEVFCDITNYLNLYKMTPKELVTKMIQDAYETTGITATAGIGSNMYLSKVAMDILAKKATPNEFGVRVAELDEMSYRKELWNHRPLTDFWRVGKGYARKLEKNGLYTMGDVARCSIDNEDLLYKLFGVNAELLIDHAWGWEPCTIEDVKAYKPKSSSITSGQVLHQHYGYELAKLIVKEMIDLMAIDLVQKKLVTDQLTLTIGYDIECLTNPKISKYYDGEITTDPYGRKVPKHSHGTINLDYHTSSSKMLTEAILKLYEKIVNNKLLIRRINISANRTVDEKTVKSETKYEQIDLFTNYEKLDKKREIEKKSQISENKIQQVVLNVKKKYGKNAIIKGMNLVEGGTTIERNKQIGGHKE